MAEDIAALLDRYPIPSPSEKTVRNEHATTSRHAGLAATLFTLKADTEIAYQLSNPLIVPTGTTGTALAGPTYFSQYAADTLFGAQLDVP